MKSRMVIILALCISFSGTVVSQNDTIHKPGKEICKYGWKAFPLPVLGYDEDLGFQYGLIGFLQYFGDGSTYPDYRHQFRAEVSRYTRGSGVNQFFYDSKYLIPGNIRLTADISYLTEKALDFYGFNGYEVLYNPDVETTGSDDYISRMFYRHERKIFRVIADFQGQIVPGGSDAVKWLAGVSVFNYKIATVDIARLNKGKAGDKKLPDVPLLYDKYVECHLIDEKEKDGGQLNFIKLGLIYDTRDFESNPSRGLWDEVIIMTSPFFFFNKNYHFTKLAVTHRQYIPLIKDRLTFAYRLAYQGTIQGTAPFYFQPYLISSFSSITYSDGLGGAKSLRGILRNRVVGDGIAYGNLEMRWKLMTTVILKSNVYLALHGFFDAGQVVQPVRIDKEMLDERELTDYFDSAHDYLHISSGAGLHIGIDENTIITIDYGMAFDRRDGRSGLYISINNLF
jgi:hypothetical protein